MSFNRKINLFFFLIFSFLLFLDLEAADSLFLKDNLQQARPGDYIVITSSKTHNLMHIYDKKENILTIEEIAVPECRRKEFPMGWKEWVQAEAPGNTSWVMYDIDISNGQMIRYYSFSKNGWFEIPDADNFLSKLLNLRLTKIPEQARKRIGSKPEGFDRRPIWQPRMIVEGTWIKGVLFDAWRTQWPKDGSDLYGRTIEIYLPQNSQQFPSYFPYWLQISAGIGKAKIRIIDSGKNLKSPKPSLTTLIQQSSPAVM